jgi:hypothetical protein
MVKNSAQLDDQEPDTSRTPATTYSLTATDNRPEFFTTQLENPVKYGPCPTLGI